MRIILKIIFILTILPVYAKSNELITPQSHEQENKWGEISEMPLWENLKIFESISEEYSKNLLNQARKSYTESIESWQETNDQLKKMKESFATDVHYEDRFEWQKNARDESRERELIKFRNAGRLQSLKLIIKAMDPIEKVSNTEIISSGEFKSLKASIYRDYIKHQMALKNWNQALDILEKYINIDGEFDSDGEAHKSLSICYDKMYKLYEKNRNEHLARSFHEKKNFHILKFTELKFGKNSKEYKQAIEQINKDYF